MLSMMTAQTTAFGAASALQTNVAARAPADAMFGKSDLEAFAKEQNPVHGYLDPIGLADLDLWGQGEEASIAWLRHAEIKHGRVAMAAFVGYIAAANYETIGAPMAPSMYPARKRSPSSALPPAARSASRDAKRTSTGRSFWGSGGWCRGRLALHIATAVVATRSQAAPRSTEGQAKNAAE